MSVGTITNSSLPFYSKQTLKLKTESPRLDYSIFESDWYRFYVDSPRLGKRCLFTNAVVPKPVYALGHTASSRRTAPKFEHARSLNMLTGTCDIAGKIKERKNFGEIKPLFIGGPCRHSKDFQLNTFDNVFGGSMEPSLSQPFLSQPPAIENNRHSKRQVENSQTKSRLIGNQSNDSFEEPIRKTGIRIVPNRFKGESNYWTTTFLRQKSVSSTHSSISDKTETEGKLKSFRDESDIQRVNDRKSGHESFSDSFEQPACDINKNKPTQHHKTSDMWSKKGTLMDSLMEQWMEKDLKPVNASDLPIHQQGLKRSEDDWFRKIKTDVRSLK